MAVQAARSMVILLFVALTGAVATPSTSSKALQEGPISFLQVQGPITEFIGDIQKHMYDGDGDNVFVKQQQNFFNDARGLNTGESSDGQPQSQTMQMINMLRESPDLKPYADDFNNQFLKPFISIDKAWRISHPPSNPHTYLHGAYMRLTGQKDQPDPAKAGLDAAGGAVGSLPNMASQAGGGIMGVKMPPMPGMPGMDTAESDVIAPGQNPIQNWAKKELPDFKLPPQADKNWVAKRGADLFPNHGGIARFVDDFDESYQAFGNPREWSRLEEKDRQEPGIFQRLDNFLKPDSYKRAEAANEGNQRQITLDNGEKVPYDPKLSLYDEKGRVQLPNHLSHIGEEKDLYVLRRKDEYGNYIGSAPKSDEPKRGKPFVPPIQRGFGVRQMPPKLGPPKVSKASQSKVVQSRKATTMMEEGPKSASQRIMEDGPRAMARMAAEGNLDRPKPSSEFGISELRRTNGLSPNDFIPEVKPSDPKDGRAFLPSDMASALTDDIPKQLAKAFVKRGGDDPDQYNMFTDPKYNPFMRGDYGKETPVDRADKIASAQGDLATGMLESLLNNGPPQNEDSALHGLMDQAMKNSGVGKNDKDSTFAKAFMDGTGAFHVEGENLQKYLKEHSGSVLDPNNVLGNVLGPSPVTTSPQQIGESGAQSPAMLSGQAGIKAIADSFGKASPIQMTQSPPGQLSPTSANTGVAGGGAGFPGNAGGTIDISGALGASTLPGGGNFDGTIAPVGSSDGQLILPPGAVLPDHDKPWEQQAFNVGKWAHDTFGPGFYKTLDGGKLERGESWGPSDMLRAAKFAFNEKTKELGVAEDGEVRFTLWGMEKLRNTFGEAAKAAAANSDPKTAQTFGWFQNKLNDFIVHQREPLEASLAGKMAIAYGSNVGKYFPTIRDPEDKGKSSGELILDMVRHGLINDMEEEGEQIPAGLFDSNGPQMHDTIDLLNGFALNYGLTPLGKVTNPGFKPEKESKPQVYSGPAPGALGVTPYASDDSYRPAITSEQPEVRIHGLTTMPELNGRHGTLLGAEGPRQHVRLDDGSEMLLKPDNIDWVDPAQSQPPSPVTDNGGVLSRRHAPTDNPSNLHTAPVFSSPEAPTAHIGSGPPTRSSTPQPVIPPPITHTNRKSNAPAKTSFPNMFEEMGTDAPPRHAAHREAGQNAPKAQLVDPEMDFMSG